MTDSRETTSRSQEGDEQPRSSNTAPSAAPPRSNWTASRVIGIVFAGIGGLIGLALLVGGIAVLAAYAFGRDDDGYFNSDRQQLETATYAITTEDIDLGVDEVDWARTRSSATSESRSTARNRCSSASGRTTTSIATSVTSPTTS